MRYHISQIGTYSDPPIYPEPGDEIEQGGRIYTVLRLAETRRGMSRGMMLEMVGPDGERYTSTFSHKGGPSQIRWAGKLSVSGL